jgi:drug/metabolite transporter (DMT)-like permease
VPAIIAAYLTCAIVWGTTWYAIRVSTGPGGYATLESVALRFTLAAVVLAPIVWRLRLGPWPRARRTWVWLLVAGALDAASYTLIYYGEERVPGGLAAVLFSTQPLMLALLLTITRVERVRAADVVGAVVALAGVGVIFADRWQVSAAQVAGLGMVLAAVVCTTAYSFVLKRHGDGVHPLVTALIFIAVTAVCLDLAVVARGAPSIPWPPPRDATLALVYLAVFGSVITFWAWLWLLQRLSLMVTSTLVFVLPVVALVVDALFERELRLGARAYLGIAIVFAGLAVALATRRRR